MALQQLGVYLVSNASIVILLHSLTWLNFFLHLWKALQFSMWGGPLLNPLTDSVSSSWYPITATISAQSLYSWQPPITVAAFCN